MLTYMFLAEQASSILLEGGALVYLKLLMGTALSQLGAGKADADKFAKELTEYTEPEDLAKVCAVLSQLWVVGPMYWTLGLRT